MNILENSGCNCTVRRLQTVCSSLWNRMHTLCVVPYRPLMTLRQRYTTAEPWPPCMPHALHCASMPQMALLTCSHATDRKLQCAPRCYKMLSGHGTFKFASESQKHPGVIDYSPVRQLVYQPGILRPGFCLVVL